MANQAVAPLQRSEIGRRLLFTAGVLLIYRLGCWVPTPGVDAQAAPGVARALKPELLSIFGLGVTPFLSVLFIFEFVKLIVPPLSRWETSEPGHALTLTRIVYLLALVCAGFQARGVTGALQDAGMLMDGPGWVIVTPLTLAAGTALLLWLGERITLHGVGNGFWLIVITPTLLALTSNAAGTFELLRMGSITSGAVIAELGFFALATALLVKTTTAGGASTESRVSGADFVAVWPPLLAAYVNEFRVTISGVEISFAAQLAMLAATIALFHGLQWLGTAPAARRPVWAIALVQIFICVGAELLTHTLQLPFPISGAWFIVIVMTAMSVVRAFGPLPETLSAKPAV